MKKVATVVVFYLLGSMADPTANAEQVYSWQQSIDVAVKNNSALSAAQYKLDSARDQEMVSRSNFFPQVTGAYSASETGSTDPALGNVVTRSSAMSLSISQSIFNGLSDMAKLRQAYANTRSAETDLITAKAQLSYDIKSAFESFVFAKEYVTLTEQILKRRQDNLRLVELRFQSGRENKGSVMLSKAYLQQAQYDLFQANNARENSRADLATALGLDDTAVDISGDVPVNEPTGASPNFQAMVSDLPSHLKSVAQEDYAESSITAARSGFFPTLTLDGSLGKTSFVDYTPDRDSWSVGLKVSVPLFSGLRDLGAVRSASANWTSSAEARKNNDRFLLSALVESFNKYREAVMKLTVDQSFRDAAQTRAEIGRSKYNNGLLTFEDWDLIENDLISRQKTFLQSKRDRVIAEASWEQSQGKGVIP